MRLFYLRTARRCAALATVAVSLMYGPALVWAQSSTALSLLAGQTTASSLPAHLKTPAWSGYAQAVQHNWQQYQTQIGAPMARWASRELPAFDGTVFYPFSGPDFATVSQLFPNAKRYVLVAMQAAQRPIDLSELKPQAAEQTLEVLTGAWQNYGRDGFFVTEYLDKYLHQNRVRIGASTFLSTFFQLKGLSLKSVVPIEVNADGQIQELDASDAPWRSARFRLERAGQTVVVDYLRIDLSDKGLSANPHHRQFVHRASAHPVLLKAASHLPQNSSFSIVADSLSTQAPFIVQDETGIKFSQLRGQFAIRLYGKFERPHKSFGQYQRDLAKAFAESPDVRPLDFRVGYFKGGSYALIVAQRKS
jgi:hypothetical protein